MNIVDPILFQCKLAAAAPALCAPGSALNLVSYGRLERFIHNVARVAGTLGIAPGEVIAVAVEDVIFHALLMLGLTRLGAVTVSTRGLTLPSEIAAVAIISDTTITASAGIRTIRADLSWLEGEAATSPHYRTRQDDACRIVLTSGTTGEPKGVLFNHAAVLRRIQRHRSVFGSGLARAHRAAIDLPLTTSLGFLFLIDILSGGGMACFRGPDPAESLQAFGLYQLEAMVAPPAALAEFVQYYEQSPAFLSPFQSILSVGSLLSPALSRRVRTRLSRNLVSAYGATEVSMVATAPAHAVEETAGAVGYLTPGVDVEILSADGGSVPPRGEGRLRIASEYAANGYVGTPRHETFRDGWFYPGDVGHITRDGLLVISGREKAVLNLGGDKISAERIEAVMAGYPDVRDSAVASFPDALGLEEVWAALVTQPNFDESAFREYCGRRLAREHWPRRIVQVTQVPRNPSGKIDRECLKSLLTSRAGDFQP